MAGSTASRRLESRVGIEFVFVSYSDIRVVSQISEYSYSFFLSEHETNLLYAEVNLRTCT